MDGHRKSTWTTPNLLLRPRPPPCLRACLPPCLPAYVDVGRYTYKTTLEAYLAYLGLLLQIPAKCLVAALAELQHHRTRAYLLQHPLHVTPGRMGAVQAPHLAPFQSKSGRVVSCHVCQAACHVVWREKNDKPHVHAREGMRAWRRELILYLNTRGTCCSGVCLRTNT